jgi:hypothetical protein
LLKSDRDSFFPPLAEKLYQGITSYGFRNFVLRPPVTLAGAGDAADDDGVQYFLVGGG